MAVVKLTLASPTTGTCAMTGKEGVEGMTVAFENEQPTFVSWKAFRQLVNFRLAQGQTQKPPQAVPLGNGPAK